MNTPKVKAIDRRSVHQICSGQVVVTLSTALKELVENSVDAGASNVEIRLKNWGADCIEVIDNGSGVLPENFTALALKHHTSKLNEFSDLVGVETFGFRGEALSSLCALSNLSITTCHHSKSIGAKIDYNHDGKITKQAAVARVPGTTVTLHNLFSTLPVRHKEFLRNLKREYAKLIQVLQSYCVISTGVRINCFTQSEKGKKNMVLSTNGNNDMRENISNIFGPKQLQTLAEFKQVRPKTDDCEEQGLDVTCFGENMIFHITGFVSHCDHGAGRSTTERQFLFINKRPCDLPKVIRVVNEVYHVYNRNQFPFLALNISLNKELVDVNVTPDKRLVFLQQEKLLLATIKSSLKTMYDPRSSSYELNEKPFTQIKPGFTKPKNEMDKSEFSRSIKDRLWLANSVKVSTPKQNRYCSIMNFAKKLKSNHTKGEKPLVSDDSSLVEIYEKDDCFLSEDGEKAKDSCGVETTIKETEKMDDYCNSDKDVSGVTDSNTTKKTDDNEVNVEETESFRNLSVDILRKDEVDCETDSECNKNADDALVSKVGSGGKETLKRKFEMLIGKESLEEADRDSKKLKMDDEFGGGETIKRKSVTVKFDWSKIAKNMSDGKELREPTNCARTFRATITPENNENAEDELKRHITKDLFHKMEIIGQFNQGFIISKLNNDLFIIDQHASDEKYNFEEQQKNTVIKSQRLIHPQSLDLTAVSESILIENVEVFRKNGFELEIDEEAPISRKVRLSSLPVSKNWSFGKPEIDELIFMLSDSPGVMYRPTSVRKMFAMRACRMSIMVGRALTKTQMKRIVGHMGEMDHPWNCPHGRPTMRHLINLNMVRK